MIRVIESSIKKYKIICHKCGALLEYESTDTREEIEEFWYLGKVIKTFWIKCPICKNKIVTKKEESLF